ncbi:MAG: hypothetical protein WC919_07205 [Candidatus Paceibacterota bacterium]
MTTKLQRHSLVAGFEDLFKSVELKLPCVIAVRNFDVYRVIKQLAIAIDIRYKFWMSGENNDAYYAVLFNTPISGADITRLIDEFESKQ